MRATKDSPGTDGTIDSLDEMILHQPQSGRVAA